MIITDVKNRRKHLTELYIDGEPAVKLAAEIWESSGFSIGSEIKDEQLRILLKQSQQYQAKEKALYLLEYRPHSKRELADKISRTIPREAALEAVEKMEALGLTDDYRYAQEYARSLFFRKGYAPRRIIYELNLKGIDRDTAQQVVDEFDVDIIENAKAIINKKYTELENEKVRRKAIQTLQRMGYGFNEIREILCQTDEPVF